MSTNKENAVIRANSTFNMGLVLVSLELLMPGGIGVVTILAVCAGMFAWAGIEYCKKGK